MFSILYSVLVSNYTFIDLIARAGGGGSSSGGGSSGGYSSGSGGSGNILMLFLYMAPLAFWFMREFCVRKRKKISKSKANKLGWSVAIACAAVCVLFGWYGLVTAVAILLGAAFGLNGWFDSTTNDIIKSKEAQIVSAQKDNTWDLDKVNKRISNVFLRYQKDWSDQNLTSMAEYLSPDYLRHNQLMVLALKQMARTNIIEQPYIASSEIIEMTDSESNAKDGFTVKIGANVRDSLFDNQNSNNTLLYIEKSSSFTEHWKFIRSNNNEWLLDKIFQTTENYAMTDEVLSNFAKQKGFFYNADWGWLLLPSRGQLFGKSKFGQSDINNHIIGIYKDSLIQLYNYEPDPGDYSKFGNYLIAQVALPKSYGNIVVRKKVKSLFSGIKDLTRISMEWGEFNDRYEVWASDMERVTSFELLNPSYMVELEALPFEVNIEVVDSVVYLYSAKIQSTPENYDIMLNILYKAFKEMRM